MQVKLEEGHGGIREKGLAKLTRHIICNDISTS